MKLSQKDREVLKSQAWAEQEIDKLEEASVICYKCTAGKKSKVLEKTARENLGDEVFLSGAIRAVFGGFSYRRTMNGKRAFKVMFTTK